MADIGQKLAFGDIGGLRCILGRFQCLCPVRDLLLQGSGIILQADIGRLQGLVQPPQTDMGADPCDRSFFSTGLLR